MYDPQYNTTKSDTPDPLYSRQYPNHEQSLALLTPSAGLHGDISAGLQTPDNFWPNIESITLPCMCHGERSQLTSLETVTQSHEPQCQYHIGRSAINSSSLRPSIKPTWTSIDWTNSPLAPSAQPKMNAIAYQDQYDPLAIETAQMQSHAHHTFVPGGGQEYNMSAHLIHPPYTERRDLTNRGVSKPQSSHVSTPNSVFSKPSQPQNFEDGYRGITTPSSIVDSKETLKITGEAMLKPQLDSGVEVYNTPKRETDNPYIHDWLSSGQDQTEAQSFHPAQDQQQAFSLDSLSLSPSYIAPDLLMNKGVSNSSSSQNYAQFDNGMYQQDFTGMFGPTATNGNFASVAASDHLNDRFHTDHGPFAGGTGQYSYNTQSYSPGGGFDFNNSPLYPADHYAVSYAPYDVEQPPNTLLTQNGNVPSAGKQLSKIRDIDRADLDEKLIKWRAQGITYKEIMNMGNWGLEESTLRGRHRTLTKPKEERVRKPKWDNAALSALVEAVDLLAPPTASSRRTTEDLGKVPWKKVTEWMQREKGCYPYGYHTIKKKYKELLSSRQMQREVNQWRRANGEHPL